MIPHTLARLAYVLGTAAVLWLIAEVLAAIDPRVPAGVVLVGLGFLAYLKGRADGRPKPPTTVMRPAADMLTDLASIMRDHRDAAVLREAASHLRERQEVHR